MNENLLHLAFEGNPFALTIIFIMATLIIVWYVNTGGDMGVHPDTGRPVKTLNPKAGRREGQRRRYHENK